MVVSPNPHDADARPLTVDQIVSDYKKSLKPELAVQNWETGNWKPYVVSPLFRQMIDHDEQIVDLETQQGRYAAIYVRVSTMQQRGDKHDDGYSVEDQIRSNVTAAVKSKLAFRIYSDAGLSGYYATNDPEVIQEIRESQAELYRQAFEEVVLRDAYTWNTETQVAAMRAFLDHRCKAIAKGEKEAMQEWKEEQVDRDWRNVELVFALRYQHHKGVRFRPALHALIDDISSIHSILVTDADRLSRNQMLFVVLSQLFQKEKVKVYSSEGAANWLTNEQMEQQILGVIYSFQAQNRIKDIKRGVLRGLFGMLRAGRPHSLLPFWLERDENGFARLVEEHVPLVRYIVSLAQRTDVYYGEARIATTLQQEGWKTPSSGNRGKRQKRLQDAENPTDQLVFHADTVGYTLRNPLLFGAQVLFGREWLLQGSQNQDLAIMSREEFWAMHERRQRVNPNARGRQTENPAPANGLMYCACGYIVRFKKGVDGHSTPSRYRCTSPPNERKAHGDCHAIFDVQELDTFLIELISDATHLFQSELDNEDSLAMQELTLRSHLEAERRRYRSNAEMQLTSVALAHDTPAYQQMLEMLVKTLMEKELHEYEQGMQRIERARLRQQSLQALRGRNDRQVDLRTLSPHLQNQSLRGYIKQIRVAADLKSMTIYLHNNETLPVVPLSPERTKTSEIPVCHVPTLSAYVASWSAASIQPDA